MLAYLVRENKKTNQTRKRSKKRNKRIEKKKPTRVLKNVMQEDQKGCKNKIPGTYYVLKRNR